MRQLIIVIFCLSIFFISCINDAQQNTSQNSTSDKIFSFSVTSKNSSLTSKSGKDVALNDMITVDIESGDNIAFKNFNFTLDHKIEGALNFYSTNGILMLNTPTKLSIMSMPPSGNGLTNYNGGDDIEISGTTLIKLNSTNFVISNIKTKK